MTVDRTVRALTNLAAIDRQLSDGGALTEGLALSLQDNRAALRAAIPGVFLAAHDALCRRGRRPVVVEVRGGHCGGCYLRLPPQLDSSIRRRQSLHLCPHCCRLLYSSPRAEEGEDTNASKPGLGDHPAMDDRAPKPARRIAGRRSGRREPRSQDAPRAGKARRSERSGNLGSADAPPVSVRPVKH
jgi:hypothetical protein